MSDASSQEERVARDQAKSIPALRTRVNEALRFLSQLRLKIWSDPVWSKVIANGVWAFMGLMFLIMVMLWKCVTSLDDRGSKTILTPKIGGPYQVLVDASKDGGMWWSPQKLPHFDPEQPHQGKRFADYLKRKHWIVRELPRNVVDMSSELAGVQIVMRFGSWKPHSSKEIEAYKRFVELGGSLMLLFRLPENGEFDRLADAFGIRIERSSGDLTNWPTSAIRFDWLDDHPASPALGLIPYGKGKVLFASIATARLLLEIQQPLVDNLLFTLSKGVEEAGPWLLAPEQQALLENGCDGAFVWEFDWMDTPGATHYWLYVFRQNAGGPAVDRSNLTVSAFQHRSTGYVGSHNTGGWRWKVRAKIDGQWGKWSEERTFNVKVCKGN